MVANKMTGERGVLFTATYVSKFEEMEKGIQGFNSNLENSPLMNVVVGNLTAITTKMLETSARVDHIDQRLTALERPSYKPSKYIAPKPVISQQSSDELYASVVTVVQEMVSNGTLYFKGAKGAADHGTPTSTFGGFNYPNEVGLVAETVQKVLDNTGSELSLQGFYEMLGDHLIKQKGKSTGVSKVSGESYRVSKFPNFFQN